MNALKSIATKITLITSIIFSTASHAEIVTMVAEWEDTLDGKYVATGLLTFDTKDYNGYGLIGGLFELNVEVIIPDSENLFVAEFSTEDFSEVLLHDSEYSSLDFSPEAGNLIGTQILIDYLDPFLYFSGDFNIFSFNGGPNGYQPNFWESSTVNTLVNLDLQFVATRLENVEAVPVPAAAWLFGSALVGLGLVRRK